MTPLAMPPPLLEWLAKGCDPADLIGESEGRLRDALVSRASLTADGRARRAAKLERDARQFAAAPDNALPVVSSSVERRRLATLRKWESEVIGDDETAKAMVESLDSLSAVEVGVLADIAQRPAPLLSEASTGELCASCGHEVPADVPMLSFCTRTRSLSPPGWRPAESSPPPPQPIWRWCFTCVRERLN